jgi:hypothetical protein
MRHAREASRLVILTSFVLLALISTFAGWSQNAALAAPANGDTAAVARLHAQLSPVLKANVICQRVREGNGIRTFSCPDGNSCVNVGGTWKCRPNAARPEQLACSVCYANQKRDSDACTRSGNLPSQAGCVNNVNAALMKCLGGCR